MVGKALLLIDIQNDYFETGLWPLFEMSRVADNAAKVLHAARQEGTMVVHIRHEFPTADAPFFRPGSAGARIHSTVAPLANEQVIVKNQINSFRETELKQVLDERKIGELVVCGAMSNVCVDAAVRAAADFGYKVTVVEDACAAKDAELNGLKVDAPSVHAAFMSALSFGYAQVTTIRELLSVKTLA
ncbi:MAG: cysteine hydrolase [Candidatus Obscuribacterales bacterium]|nr:cysteine hydrolase [Candidatus Obscuribacterales bacterium]